MRPSESKKVMLTFDVEGPPGMEDFAELDTLKSFYRILKLLEKYDLHALFFITGNLIENIHKDKEIFNLLEKHEIGFHSSSHSIKPRIFEYTDLPDYDEAIKVSIERETSKINKFTGKIEGSGGILSLREYFPDKKIESFRAPFNYFSPPHIEALREIGIKYVFSGISLDFPFLYKGLTYFPEVYYLDDLSNKIVRTNYLGTPIFFPLFLELYNMNYVVLGCHPHQCYFEKYENNILKFRYLNSMHPFYLRKKHFAKIKINYLLLEFLLYKLKLSHKKGLVDVSPEPKVSNTILDTKKIDVRENYEYCLSIATELFRYKPRYLLSQLYHFFEINRDILRNLRE